MSDSSIAPSVDHLAQWQAVDAALRQRQIVYGVAYSPNNARYLAVAGGLTQSNRPGTVTIWDVGAKSTYASYSGVRSQPLSVTFSPSGNAIVVGEGGCGRVLLCTN